MLKELNKLSASELETMIKAPLLVCILIAGADNEIDNNEIKGAIQLAKSSKARAKSKDSVSQFYEMVTEGFEDKLKIILQGFPNDSLKRNPLLFEELGRLNKILPKMEKKFASGFYQSLLHIAEKIAESSGGVLGMKTVGDEEDRLMSLPMIKNPSAV